MKIFKYIILPVLILGVSACGEDFLEIAPDNALPFDSAIQSVDDLEATLIGVYAQMQDADWYGRYFVLIPDIMSDDVKQNSQANRGKDWAEYVGSVNDLHNIPTNIWTELYEAINRANLIINAELDIPASVQSNANQFIGEAYAMRALAHFDLVRAYGQHYGFSSDNSHPGVAIVTEFDQNAEPSRNTVAEVYAQVESDLNQAISLMSESRGNGFFSPTSAKALLARVALYKNDLSKAGSLADEVINSGEYTLTASESYVAQWQDIGFSPDVILDVIQTENDNVGSDALGGMYNSAGYGDYLPSMDLVGLIDTNDLRYQLFVEDADLGGGDLGTIRVGKFPSGKGEDNTPVLRLAEMYLIRAESRASNGDEPGAIEDLMTIRRRAWPDAPDVTATGQALLDEIAKEKTH